MEYRYLLSMFVHGHISGGKRTPTYISWQAMKRRVRHPKHKKYENCTVDARWDPEQGGSFQNFLDDMGERPEGSSLDKDSLISGNRHYGPGRCAWLNITEQNLNRKGVHKIEYDGRVQSAFAWCKELGINRRTLVSHIKQGWSAEKAITECMCNKIKWAMDQPSLLPDESG